MDALAMLQKLAGGRAIEEWGEQMKRTMAEVVETGKPGTVTLKVNISNSGIGEEMMLLKEEVSRGSPKRDPHGSFLYFVDGDAHAEDPRQTRMALREVTGGRDERQPPDDAADLREVR